MVNKLYSTGLYELVKSLTKAEKKHFSLYIRRNAVSGKSGYLSLFRAIVQAGVNDEKAIADKCRMIPASQLSNVKNYLCRLVLRSLRDFHAGSSTDLQLREAADHAELLYQKGFYSHASAMLSRALRLAYRYEKFPLILELLPRQEELLRLSADMRLAEAETIRIRQEERVALRLYQNMRAYMHIASDMYLLVRHIEKARSPAERSPYEKMIRNPILQNISRALSYHARYYYLQNLATYYFALNDTGKYYELSMQLFELMETNPHQKTADARKYVTAVNNAALASFYRGDFPQAEQYIHVLELFHAPTPLGQVLRFINYYNLRLLLLIHAGVFREGLSVIPEIERGMAEYGSAIGRDYRMRLYFKTAILCFGAGDFPGALAWIRKITEEADPGLMEDTYCFALIVQLIIHYELGNTDLLEYMVRSVYRFLIKRRRLYKFETLVLQFIQKKLHAVQHQEQLGAAFRILKDEIEKITSDPFERKALEYFDFLAWLESKITGRTFGEVVRGQGGRR